MPIFEYRCNDCSAKFEELVSRSDDKVSCPECGSENTSKLLSMFAASASGGAVPSRATGGCGTGGFS